MSIWDKFVPEMYPDRVCCGIFEHLKANGYSSPFYRPMIQAEDKDTAGWAVRIYQDIDKRTMRPLVGGSFTMFLAHCPFCGVRIMEKENEK